MAMPIYEEGQCNQVIDSSMFLVRIGMEYSEQHQCYLIQEGWEEVHAKMLACQNAGGVISGQAYAIPKQPCIIVGKKAYHWHKKAQPQIAQPQIAQPFLTTLSAEHWQLLRLGS